MFIAIGMILMYLLIWGIVAQGFNYFMNRARGSQYYDAEGFFFGVVWPVTVPLVTGYVLIGHLFRAVDPEEKQKNEEAVLAEAHRIMVRRGAAGGMLTSGRDVSNVPVPTRRGAYVP